MAKSPLIGFLPRDHPILDLATPKILQLPQPLVSSHMASHNTKFAYSDRRVEIGALEKSIEMAGGTAYDNTGIGYTEDSFICLSSSFPLTREYGNYNDGGASFMRYFVERQAGPV